MAGATHMTLAEARERIPDRGAGPDASPAADCPDALPDRVRMGRIETIARSAGGRPIYAVSYGEAEPAPRLANYNSAIGAREPAAFADTARRSRPVLLLVGPVHGQETEGLFGLDNLIAVLETGRDRAGVPRPELVEAARSCRLIIVPTGNPDGVARFEPRSLAGMGLDDLRFWGQGTRADHSLWGWPGCKSLHPMKGDVGFLGCYFNDAGVNPMHDEFFSPLSDEAPAILRLAMREAPDVAVSLHSHAGAPAILRPAYVPREQQERVREVAAALRQALADAGLPAGREPAVSEESGNPPAPFNLVSALYHACGAAAMTFECPHGLSEESACSVSPKDITEIQLCLYRVLLKSLPRRGENP